MTQRKINKIPGWESIAAFERHHGLPEGTGKRHMQRGYCQWPRRTSVDGRRDHPLYKKWRSIIDRCTVKGHTSYKSYGGRGIKVSPEWYTDFWQFVKDIEALPKTGGTTLDRIDNNGSYEKGNVRWATHTDQNFNQRLHSDNKTGIRGLAITRQGYWQGLLQHQQKVYRKTFKTKEQAIDFLQRTRQELGLPLLNIDLGR